MQRVVLAVAAVFCCIGISAQGQGTFKRSQDFDWKIAQRFDDGRVVIMLSMDDNYIEKTVHDEIVGERLPGKPMAVFLDGVSRAQADWVRKTSPTTAQLGDKWVFDGGRAGWFHAAVDDFVIAGSGCSDAGALSAAVDPADRLAFGRVRAKYFPIHSLDGWTPPAATTGVGPVAYVVTPGEHQEIERLLRDQFKRTSDKTMAGMSSNGRDEQTSHFREIYRRLARGEGNVRFDTQSFRLTPDRIPRLFVRAIFILDRRQVYFLSAWIKTKPVMTVEAVDAGAASLAWMHEYDHDTLDPLINGQVMNVSDVDRDGTAEVLMRYDGYESFVLDLVRYPPTEPRSNNVLARWGAGC